MNYFISKSGNDSAAGTQAAPFLTIQKAANLVVAGDIVNVEPASTPYAGFILSWNNPQAGTAALPIIFQADPATTTTPPEGAATPAVVIGTRNNETQMAVDLEPGSNFVFVRGFTITNDGTLTKCGIKTCGNSSEFTNLHVIGAAGIANILTDNANDVIIANNISEAAKGTDEDGHGLYISGTCDGVVVENNQFLTNGYHAIHLNGDASEGGVGAVTNAVIRGNIMLNNPGNGINGDGLQGATIENNLIVGFTKYGVSIYTEDAGVPSSGNEIINNTIVGPNSYELQNGATGIVSFNNIILASAPQVDSTSSLKTSNNITTGTPASLFVSPATGNYQLLAGASAIGAGVATFSGDSAPSTDILGTSRNGRFDCGAYEYGATVTPPPPPPPPTPVVTLTGSPNDLVSAVYTLSITAQDTGNPIASYAITWGDGSPVQTVLASPDVVSGGVATSTTTAQHTYATVGTYKISAVATDVSGTVAAGGPSVNVTAVVVPPPPPPPPSPLTITINSASGSGSNANVSLTITGSGAAALLAAL